MGGAALRQTGNVCEVVAVKAVLPKTRMRKIANTIARTMKRVDTPMECLFIMVNLPFRILLANSKTKLILSVNSQYFERKNRIRQQLQHPIAPVTLSEVKRASRVRAWDYHPDRGEHHAAIVNVKDSSKMVLAAGQ
jgi:hypothetical protein